MEEVPVKACGDQMLLHILPRHDPFRNIVSEIDHIVVYVRDIKDLAAVPDGQVNTIPVYAQEAFRIDLFRFLFILCFFVFLTDQKEEFLQCKLDDPPGSLAYMIFLKESMDIAAVLRLKKLSVFRDVRIPFTISAPSR